MTEEKEYTCINCGNPVKNLYRKYSETVLKLTECENCKNVADKYVEYDTVIIIIDLILLRIMAYRHFILNSEFKNFWKLSIILLLLETYSNWTVSNTDVHKISLNDTTPCLTETDIYLEDFKFYKLCFNETICILFFVTTLYLFTVLYTFIKKRKVIPFLMVYKTVTLSSTGIFLFLPSLIWNIGIHELHIHFVSLYTTLSQLLAYKALCDCEKIWSLFVIFSSLVIKTLIGDSSGVVQQFKKDFCLSIQNMAFERRGSYKNGFWIWDELNNGLLFVGRDIKTQDARLLSIMSTAPAPSISSGPVPGSKDVQFRETLGSSSQVKFRKHYQRQIKRNQPDVITIQDIKDVAIYTCNLSFLTPEFISYFHTKAMDNFLRSLIIYFQYYFQVWNKMQLRRKEAKRKLRQPRVTELENIIRDDLADLRSMVARDYSVILMGIGDAKKFHHMNNKNNDSFSDRDRHLFECLMILTVRVVWIALFRKYMSLIEKELNRLLRTNIFNPLEHTLSKNTMFDTTPEEDRILIGKAFTTERMLLHRSPAVQEIIMDSHDYRMLGIGVNETEFYDERQKYLEAAYAAPEELLWDMEMGIGILGIPRKYMDLMLKPKEISTTEKTSDIMKPIPEFVIPPRGPPDIVKVSSVLPKKPCRYQETKSTKEARKHQCKIWREYVESGGSAPAAHIDMLALSPSHMTLRTSIVPVYSKYN